MGDVVDITERLPHGAYYVACMICAYDWVAVVPAIASWPIECPECGKMKGEKISYSDLEWFKRFMNGPDHNKRAMVLLNAKRIEDTQC